MGNDLTNLAGDVAVLQGDLTNLGGDVSALQAYNEAATTVAEAVRPSIVRVNVETFGGEASGTGIIVDSSGYVITNHHVIDNARSVEVVLHNGETYEAIVFVFDEDLDLAILRFDPGDTQLQVATLSNYDDITVGEPVLVIGFPFYFDLGEEISVSSGIVSAIRIIDEFDQEFIQIDAPVNPGNSGDPLVNLRGEIIGINSLTYFYFDGLSFAVTIKDIKEFINSTIGS